MPVGARGCSGTRALKRQADAAWRADDGLTPDEDPAKVSPEAIFKALHEVALRDMKLAWLLGELRHLPSRLAGHLPAADSKRPFWSTLIE